MAQFALSCPLRCFMVGLRAEDSELVTGILLCTVKEALSVKYTGDNAFFSGEFYALFCKTAHLLLKKLS